MAMDADNPEGAFFRRPDECPILKSCLSACAPVTKAKDPFWNTGLFEWANVLYTDSAFIFFERQPNVSSDFRQDFRLKFLTEITKNRL